MKITSRSVSVLATAAALILGGCGGDDADESGPTRSASPIDRAFVAEMVPHHESGVQMAQIAQRRGESAFVTRLAGDIVRSQTAEIAALRAADRRLERAGVKRGSLGVPDHMMGMDASVSTLRTARQFDRTFINLMIPHHEGALVMARAELDKGKDSDLRALAEDIIAAQQREISAMRAHLGASGDEHGPGDMHAP